MARPRAAAHFDATTANYSALTAVADVSVLQLTKTMDAVMAPRPLPPSIRTTVAATALLMAAGASLELAMGRVALCRCGVVRVWQGQVFSSENSQQFSDWYSLTHVSHGFIFFALLAWLAHRWPVRTRFLAAVAFETAWEVLENTPFVIDRYRATTISLDYYGDSVLNSMSDVAMMMLGFWLARRLPWRLSAALVAAVELLLLVNIRDNLTLNILMLLHPVEAVRTWQSGV